MDVEDKKIEKGEIPPLGTNIAAMIRDMARMVDLQFQLVSLEVRQFWSNARIGITVTMLAGCTILGSLPVLLFGIAELLQRLTGWSHGVCLLTLGSTFIGVAACVLWFAVMQIGRAAESFKGSQEELAQNLKWVREVLHRDE